MNKATFKAAAMLIGTTIGAGIFAIPYAVSKFGFIPGFLYILALGGVVLIMNLMYGQIVLSTNGKHQLTGYAQKYIGGKGRAVALFSMFLGLYGGLIAYIVKVGQFLYDITAVQSSFVWSLVFFAVMSSFVFIGLKVISRFDLVFASLLILAICLLILLGLPSVKISQLNHFDMSFFFLPYGVILFALGGASIIPEMGGVFDRAERAKLKKAIVAGTLIPVLIYALFAFVVVGVTGLSTADDAVTSLMTIHPLMFYLGAIAGIFGMSTAFLSLGTVLKDIYQYDFRLPKVVAWMLACFVPLLLFLSGLNQFVTIIGVAGALMSGFEGIVIVTTYYRTFTARDKEPEYTIRLPKWAGSAIIIVFSLGILYEVLYFLDVV